jgi:transcriptional regulator with XRE-family HTH domain
MLRRMSERSRETNLFRVLLRHQRQRRGMSQLDLSIAAEVSARHISFLETGRAAPSREMIMRLATALGLGLRDTNTLLQGAGLPRAFAESSLDQPWPEPVERVIARMLRQQEPYPMVVLNTRGDVLRTNRAASVVLPRFVHDPGALTPPLNIAHAMFNPRLLRPYLENWPALAALEFVLRRAGEHVRFLSTLTMFNAVLDVGLEDLKLESYFPADDHTDALCRRLAENAS